jgi:hypothetical protein
MEAGGKLWKTVTFSVKKTGEVTVSIATGSTAAAVDSMGRAMELTDVLGSAVNDTVRNMKHEITMAMSAAKSALPVGATMIVPNSEIAKEAGPGVAASTS